MSIFTVVNPAQLLGSIGKGIKCNCKCEGLAWYLSSKTFQEINALNISHAKIEFIKYCNLGGGLQEMNTRQLGSNW